MTFFSTALAFVVTLGLLIVFHEFGHYLMARWCGVKVLRFSIGFGQPLLSKRWGKDQTEWVIAAFPLGGYVKMLDEREGSVAPQELPQSFNRKPVAHRFAIVAAGPAANFLLAILLYWLLFMLGVAAIKPVIGTVPPATPAAFAGFERGETITKIGGDPVTTWQDARWLLLSHVVDQSSSVTLETVNPLGHVDVRQVDVTGIQPDDLDGDFLKKIGLTIYQPDMEPIIAQVTPESAGSRAGLRAGDRILEVNSKQIALWEELVQEIRANPGTLLRLRIQRNSETVSIEAIPDTATEGSEKVGKLGIGPKIDQAEFEKLMVEISYAPGTAMVRAISKTWETSVFTLQMLGKMLAGQVSWKNVSGPITIADYAGKSAQMGVAPYLGFLALISISLGVLNLLPIPVLDGGHLMYYVIEIIKGSPLSAKTAEIGQQVGMALLFALMAFAIYNDVVRLIPS
ncbi:regulator of sigma E protease [Nitrosospira sp. Nsp14]|uniref:RIP metalloprotease RseP n=1 Tax=Nitrosospira sp. Nsp14 TaxID=1855333 RepID=UPI0008EEBFE5|nr:RIP metalloprotease RseP [Nitrosospira sp. Nsp14]SFH49036.1 regulator of sigma E protease [Nitrosospira sp. Nsp14]